ncbi:transposase [Dolichospermum planctonicum CS-1226]|uniref:Transposase n=1 Tax=Dolichospermum planctonicum CS-1226 TaxID=3021751 RepID=A0ABT5ADW7_9CYAN|nr:transposase [Dolichospermum planctonicum]MDB9535436.1 transposase [Dolichospermum planctonicum CS-1226]
MRYHRKLHKDLYNAAVNNRFIQYQKFNHKVDYFEQKILPIDAVGIDLGCKSALSITDGENHQLDAPKFHRIAEQKIKKASKEKRRKRAPNRNKKIKASRRYKKAQTKVSQLVRTVANQRQNWVHQVAVEIISSNSFIATEKLEVKNMTSKAKKRRSVVLGVSPMNNCVKKGKRKKQKAGLNKSILDVGFGMLQASIKYKVELRGVFVEVPTRQVKPSQTPPKCGNQHQKTLDIRVHECGVCEYIQDRDIAAAEVMLYWVKGTLPGLGTSLVDADLCGATSRTRKKAGSMRQLGEKKRQKSQSNSANNKLEDVETFS